jgi:MFS family permease
VVALRQYRGVWKIPGAPAMMTFGIVGRLAIGMTPLALLLVVENETGSYSLAAVAGAIYAIAGAALSPVAGRVADRVGPTPVLLVTAIAHPLALGWLLLASDSGVAPVYTAAAVAGATYPPMSAAIRGAWNDLTDPASGRYGLRNAALAAETTLFELVFVLGPLLVAGFVLLADAKAALVGAGVVTLVGTVVVALGRAMRAWRPHPRHTHARGLGPLRVSGFPALLFCVLGLGIAFGAAGVTVPAYASAEGVDDPDSVAGVLLAVWAIGSASAGFWFGARKPAVNVSRQFAWLLAGVSGSFVLFALMPNPAALGVALVVGGAAIAPALTLENTMVGRIAPPSMLNEAYTWVVTTAVAASAIGGAAAGVIVDHVGVPWAFLFAGAAVAATVVVAALPSGSIARADARASLRLDALAGNAG